MTVAAREAARPFVLALDVGTSSVRAALYDSAAREVEGARARVEWSFSTTADGGAEVEADAAVALAAGVVDRALTLAEGEGVRRVELLATACFWHSLVGVDDEGRAVTPVYGWADTRAASDAAALREQMDERETHARTGCRFHASYWPAKLLRIKRERPAEWRAARRWMTFGELLMLRLCGAGAASVSMASGTGLLNLRACEWDAPLATTLGVKAEQLPALARDGETFALTEEFAARWPALRGARVLAPVGDGAANNIGEACASRERAALMVGTSAAMRVVYEGEPPASLDPALWCYRADRRRVAVGGALSDGGGLFAWLKRTLATGARDGEALERALDATGPDAHGLTVLPFWSGERSTGWHPFASGAVLGLTAHTRPEEIVRACLEAIAYRLALVARSLDAHAPGAEVRASGGALRASPPWAQMISDVLGRPLRLSAAGEASARGAVLLALEAAGAIKSVADFEAPAAAAVEPDEARHAVYLRASGRQQRLYELLVGDQQTARLLRTPV
ncbi:MAG TPA: gluconokinase [Pyrinomonadaceae bacterium]|nr:gluconokinase [Pyrinomonadaceae bacterium]